MSIPHPNYVKTPRIADRLDGAAGGDTEEGYIMNFLVPNKMVGAVIGVSGSAIKEMCQTSGARISVLNRDAVGSTRTERIVEVEGPLSNLSTAFKLIQERIEAEAEAKGVEADDGEDRIRVPLKLLVANELIGHIIGKKRASIQQLINDSGTDITISQPESAHLGPGTIRVVTVQGSLGAVCLAQSLICSKLHSILRDPDTRPQEPVAAAALFGASAFPIIGGKSEKNIVLVLESMIGSIIGKGGNHAKEITRQSECKLHIETREEKAAREEANPPSSKKGPDGEEIRVQDERKIFVMGSPNAQFRAQGMIYQLLCDDDQRQGNRRERRLKVHFAVPNSMLGRLIGKGGQKIKELADTSGARLKLLRGEDDPRDSTEGDTFIEIFGTFAATQAAQNLIRQMALEHRLRDQQQPK